MVPYKSYAQDDRSIGDEDEAEGLRHARWRDRAESQAELIREGVRRLLREGVSRRFHSMGKGEGPGGPRPRWNH